MKIKLIFLLCLFEAFSVTSCLYYSEMYNFNEEDIVWMEPYEQGDTILFCSSDELDTMVVEQEILNDSHSPFAQNEGASIYTANSIFKNKIFHRGDSVRFHFLIVKENDDILTVNFRFNYRDSKSLNQQDLNIQQYSFQGAKYDDVIIIDDSNSQIRVKSPYNCEYFIWSKSKGLLQYKYLNGEVYTFYKKLPYKRKD